MINSIITYGTPILTAIGVFVAAYGIMRNTENAKKKATIDLIMTEYNDKELQQAIRRVNELSKIPDCILATYTSDEDSKRQDRDFILKVLNQREFIAVGILGGAFHEKIYKEFQYSMFLRDWENLNGFIAEMRKTRQAPTAFQEFEILAKKWKKHPLKAKH